MALEILGVIPVRMTSTRLPGKPLKDICGKTLVQRVWEQATSAQLLTDLVIATDDEDIAKEAERICASYVMTPSDVLTGTDRVAAACKGRETLYDFVVNIQGDMPFIKGEVIDQLIAELEQDGECGMGTIATPIEELEEFERSSCVKVVTDTSSRALYFSRAQIPFPRDGFSPEHKEPFGLKHIGLYAFRPSILQRVTSLPQTLVERREGLEQLRALSNGIKIKICTVPRALIEPSVEVDTPEDLQRAIEIAKKL